MKRVLLPVFLLLTGLAFLLPQALTAQSTDESPTTKPETDARGPLPFYYGKLGLDEDQKQKLYTIQAEFDAKVEAIQNQIAKVRSEQDAKMQILLTPGQKLRLQELREAATKKKAEEDAQPAQDATPPTSP